MSLNTKAFTTEDWQAKRDQFVARGVSNGNRHLAAKGEGAVLYDIDGRRFIDFAGGDRHIKCRAFTSESCRSCQAAGRTAHPSRF